MRYAILPQRGLLSLSGEDTRSFLQGLVTNDMAALTEGSALYATLLTPQGKYLHDFFLFADGETIFIDCEKARMSDLLDRLKLYTLRSKVAIEALPEGIGVAAAWGDSGNKDIAMFEDPRLSEMGYRQKGGIPALNDWCQAQGWEESSPEDYDAMRLALGVPDGSRDLVPEKSFPLQFGFEELHGVDFKKGCYVGQEVTARTKHLGQIRKYLYQVRAEEGQLPDPGTPIYLGEMTVGEMRSHAGNIGLALLRIEEAEKAGKESTPLRAGDCRVRATLPKWAGQALS